MYLEMNREFSRKCILKCALQCESLKISFIPAKNIQMKQKTARKQTKKLEAPYFTRILNKTCEIHTIPAAAAVLPPPTREKILPNSMQNILFKLGIQFAVY